MRHALRLAARSLGQVAPNPAVGCIIVSPDGAVVGRGWTARGGRPHAETIALAQAGEGARGATIYVTLEPCAHLGQTPPCADALIAAGVSRVVGAVIDPDPRVKGGGFAKLAAAGIEVVQGVGEADARALNAGFVKRIEQGRPLVALKIAQSADGYVAAVSPKTRWITSERARRRGHLLRAQHDAIMVGIGTVLADDPMLTCRLEGLEHRSPLRIVVDSSLRLPPSSQLARTARETPVLVFTAASAGGGVLAASGVEIARVEADADGRPDLDSVLRVLAARGLTRVLVEGGPTLQSALLARGLCDTLYRYTAPVALGGGLRSPLAQHNGGTTDAAHFTFLAREPLGPDLLETFAVNG
jgi:diaminohydroxyphosphoribosylaminopyrimidine deaminase/5-amino-6-(5-phosphoribosylamino)uracil reductase